jgi:hypothetical protein
MNDQGLISGRAGIFLPQTGYGVLSVPIQWILGDKSTGACLHLVPTLKCVKV